MKWLERLNDALEYIENNLENNISYEEAARLACCSVWHFQKMFSYIAEIPLSEYIRRRRMTNAAFELQSTDIRIIDLSLKYGYDSPTSFNRAFRSIHGISPSQARNTGITLTAYPKINFSLTIKGNKQLQYRIENKEAFSISGLKKELHLNIENNFKILPAYWKKSKTTGVFKKLHKIAYKNLEPIMGVTIYENSKKLQHYIAIITPDEKISDTFKYTIPASKWVIFNCTGAMPDAIQELYKRFYTEWLPNSGYEYTMKKDIELYYPGDEKSPDYKFELWFSIKKTNSDKIK